MAFNSDTYAMNQYRRDVDKRLAEARRLKAEGGQEERVEIMVRLARSSMNLFRIYRTEHRLRREARGLDPSYRAKSLR